MEGLIPFVYKTIMHYKSGQQGPIGSWLNESPSASYMRLPAGDSGRFQVFLPDYGFSTATTSRRRHLPLSPKEWSPEVFSHRQTVNLHLSVGSNDHSNSILQVVPKVTCFQEKAGACNFIGQINAVSYTYIYIVYGYYWSPVLFCFWISEGIRG